MKLSNKQREQLWGEDGPYSEVNLIFENRILDDKDARNYYYIKIEINPLTFDIVEKNLDDFKDDEWVMSIYESHEEREDGNGYEAYPFRTEYIEKSDYKKAQAALKESKKAVTKMHKYVMQVLGNLNSI
ncbi:MAG: hypothetical protein PF572_06855 [Patescibacteria group bacterium]|jgi:hypothetical protein|nr:hypothetical protein [Patescibacteria group bacterium]